MKFRQLLASLSNLSTSSLAFSSNRQKIFVTLEFDFFSSSSLLLEYGRKCSLITLGIVKRKYYVSCILVHRGPVHQSCSYKIAKNDSIPLVCKMLSLPKHHSSCFVFFDSLSCYFSETSKN